MASSISKNHSNLKPHSLWNEGLPAIQQKATKETKRGLPLRSLRLHLFKTSQHDRLSLLSNANTDRRALTFGKPKTPRQQSQAQTAVRCSAIDTPIKALVGLCYHREQSGGECYKHSPRYELY